jgi:hypothetical protein
MWDGHCSLVDFSTPNKKGTFKFWVRMHWFDVRHIMLLHAAHVTSLSMQDMCPISWKVGLMRSSGRWLSLFGPFASLHRMEPPCPLSHRSIYVLISLCLFSVAKQKAREREDGEVAARSIAATKLNGSRPKWSNFSFPPIFILGGLSLFAHMIKKGQASNEQGGEWRDRPLAPCLFYLHLHRRLHVSFSNIITATHHRCFCMNLYTWKLRSNLKVQTAAGMHGERLLRDRTSNARTAPACPGIGRAASSQN